VLLSGFIDGWIHKKRFKKFVKILVGMWQKSVQFTSLITQRIAHLFSKETWFEVKYDA